MAHMPSLFQFDSMINNFGSKNECSNPRNEEHH